MNVRRTIGAAGAVIAVATGAGLFLSATVGGAATPAPPTPITLNLTGLASAACPLPLNGSLALKPGTSVLLQRDVLLGVASTQSVVIKPAPNSTDPKSSKTISSIPSGGAELTLSRPATYTLTWQTKTLAALLPPVLSATQTGKLVINANAQKCVVAVSVPAPSLSVPGVPTAVTGPINGGLGGVASTINSVAAPVNSAVGPVLGTVNEGAGGITSQLPLGPKPVSSPTSSKPGTIYKPTGPTVADRTVPKGYGNGSGLGGTSVSGDGSSINAPAIGLVGTDSKSRRATAGSSAARQIGSPASVDLSSGKSRSALADLSKVLAIVAIAALLGATAFYARAFLVQPALARLKR